MDRVRFWQHWLAAASVFVALFGLALVVIPPLGGWLFGWLLLGSLGALEGLGQTADAYIRLVHGVLGAVMFGSWSCSVPLEDARAWRGRPSPSLSSRGSSQTRCSLLPPATGPTQS